MKVETDLKRTARVMQMSAMFDVPPAEREALTWKVDAPLEERDWNIGLIVGPSGAGKSSVASEMFPSRVVRAFGWDGGESVLDGFPKDMSIKDVVGLLSSVGFSSPPAWMRPYQVLSTGEKFRATVARALAEMRKDSEPVVVDEFTSVVDRQVAKIASHSVARTVRREGRKFVAVSCHHDIVDWLQPDWVLRMPTCEFNWRCLQRRPTLQLEVFEVDRSAWELFKHHHYLSGELHVAAQCFGGFIEGHCVSFTSYLHFPHAKTRNIKMGHRLVVLPDYQGLGIGGRLDDWLGEHLYAQGYRYRNVVAHPAMVAYYSKSPRWRCAKSNNGAHARRRSLPRTTSRNKALRARNLDARKLNTHSFEYAAKAR